MILSLRKSAHIYAACLVVLVCFASGNVFATADGPDYYRVVDVTVNNVLNIRASPNTSGIVIGTIPSNADGIANFGCIGGLTMTEYERVYRNQNIVFAVVNVVLNLVLIPLYGTTGAALATAISMIGINVVAMITVRRRLGFWTLF